MAQQIMYPGIPNSPQTELADAIDDTQTTIPLVDASKVPDGPNIAVIGKAEDAETIIYTAKSGNDLMGATRGIEGVAKSWVAGTKVARNFTNRDYAALTHNVGDLVAGLDDLAGVGRTTETVKGNADALDAHKAETTQQFDDRGINIKDFGAVGDDGGTDCSQAIIDAIAACPPGGRVIIPPAPGFYKVLLGKIVIDKTISLEGSSSGDDQGSGDVNSCRLVFFANGSETTAIEVNRNGVTLKNFTMFGASAQGTGNIGIKAQSKINNTLERIWIRAFDYAVKYDDCIQCTFRQVNVRDCITGFSFETGGTSMLLEQCWVQNARDYGYVVDNHSYCTFINCLTDGNESSLSSCPDNAFSLRNSNSINLVGCASETIKKSHIHISNCDGVTISNYFGYNGNLLGGDWGLSLAYLEGTTKNIVFINPKDYQPAAGTVASITKAYVGAPPVIIGGSLAFGYNDQGSIITVPDGAILIGFAGIFEDAIYLRASDTGARKIITVNDANTITAANA